MHVDRTPHSGPSPMYVRADGRPNVYSPAAGAAFPLHSQLLTLSGGLLSPAASPLGRLCQPKLSSMPPLSSTSIMRYWPHAPPPPSLTDIPFRVFAPAVRPLAAASTCAGYFFPTSPFPSPPSPPCPSLPLLTVLLPNVSPSYSVFAPLLAFLPTLTAIRQASAASWPSPLPYPSSLSTWSLVSPHDAGVMYSGLATPSIPASLVAVPQPACTPPPLPDPIPLDDSNRCPAPTPPNDSSFIDSTPLSDPTLSDKPTTPSDLTLPANPTPPPDPIPHLTRLLILPYASPFPSLPPPCGHSFLLCLRSL